MPASGGGEISHATDTHVNSPGARGFSAFVRTGMDRICKPGRSLHVQFPESTEDRTNHLPIAASTRFVRADLYRNARPEPLHRNCASLHPASTNTRRES